MEFITSVQATAHITPAQDALWHKYFGMGSGILVNEYGAGTLRNFMLAMPSGYNTVKITSGVACMQGRIFEVAYNTEDGVTFESTTSPDKWRHDMIVAAYTYHEDTGTESMEWKVKKGVEVDLTETPQDPDVDDVEIDVGNTYAEMAMYRVVVMGAQSPRCDIIAPLIYGLDVLAEEKNIIDKLTTTKSATVSTVPGGSMTFYRSGNVVMAVHPTKVYSGLKTGQKNILLNAGGIPEGFRPITSIRTSNLTIASHVPNTSEVLDFNTDGGVGVWIANTAATEFSGSWTYITGDDMPA